RIDEHHRDSSERGFVNNKLSQLEERPTVQRGSLGLPNRDAVADALEVLQHNATTGALSLGHDAFADCVVDVGGEFLLFVPPPFEQPPRGTCAFSLEAFSQSSMAVAQSVDVSTGVCATIRVRCDVDDAEVDTEVVGYLRDRQIRDVDRRVQEERAVPVD